MEISKNNLSDKNILYLAHDYKAFIKDQIELLSRNFKEVYVLVRYKPIAEIYSILPFPFLKEHTFSNQFDSKNLPSNVHVFAVPLWYLPNSLGYKILGNKHLKAVERIIKREKIHFDIIHAHFLWTAGYVGMKLKERYDVPLVVTGHGYDVYELPFQDNFLRDKISEVLKNSDGIITVSKNNELCIRQLNIKKEVNIIGNGYLEKKFFQKSKTECRRKLGLPMESKILLTIGGLDKVKGQKFLIDAVSLLIKKKVNVLCYIIGVGGLENSLRREIKDLGLEDNVFLIGSVEHGKIVDWINASDLFVLPSLAESFGLVQLESLACGVPVICTKNSGSLELISSEDYGLLCEIGDSVDLAKKIEKGLRKKWEGREMIKYAENFTWNNVCEKITNIYKRLLK